MQIDNNIIEAGQNFTLTKMKSYFKTQRTHNEFAHIFKFRRENQKSTANDRNLFFDEFIYLK